MVLDAGLDAVQGSVEDIRTDLSLARDDKRETRVGRRRERWIVGLKKRKRRDGFGEMC